MSIREFLFSLALLPFPAVSFWCSRALAQPVAKIVSVRVSFRSLLHLLLRFVAEGTSIKAYVDADGSDISGSVVGPGVSVRKTSAETI